MTDARGPVLAALGAAASGAAALAAAQVLLAEWTGLTTLGVSLEAGAERVQGVQFSLVIWFCAVSAPIAMLLVPAGRGLALRLVTAGCAAAATVAVLPIVHGRGLDRLHDDLTVAVLTGAVLGLMAALGVARLPAAGRGLAAHTVLVWVLALVWLPTGTVILYPGLMEPMDVPALDALDSVLGRLPLPREYGYHLAMILPGIVAVLVLCGVLTRRALRDGGGWRTASATAVAGPVLAVAAYYAGPDHLVLWNESAAGFAVLTAVLALLVAATVIGRTRQRTERLTPAADS